MVLRTSFPRDFKALNNALQNSFAGMKKDMDEIKGEIRSSQVAHASNVKELHQQLEGLKQQFVTVDKFNLIKIRLAEFGEQFRRIDKAEKSLHDLDERTTALASLSKSITELKTELGVVDKTAKTAVTEGQMKRLVEEINAEFNAVKEDISKVENKGGKVADLRIERFSEQVEGKLDDLRGRVQRLQETTAEQVKRASVETLITDVNAEFDRVKASVQKLHEELKEVRGELKELHRDAAMKEDVSEEIKQLRKLLNTIRLDARSETPRSMIFQDAKPKAVLKEAFMKLGKKRGKVTVVDEQPRPRGKLLIISTVIIILSFICLGASVAAFFFSVEWLMDYLIIAAIAIFIVGIILRVVALVRAGSDEE